MLRQPNIVERLQEIDAICSILRTETVNECEDCTHIEGAISDIEGIVGEILTMIDGR